MKPAVKPNRRQFLAAAGTAAAACGVPYLITGGAPAARGANERLTMAHIGVGGMGGSHLRDMVNRRSRGEVNIAAVCDVDEKRLAAAVQAAGPGVTPYRDYRYILERNDIDAVVIATPDHWHGVQTVHACQTGKHVYVEKPACCT
ncbi:MAG: Gfo/Idh/MocA family oxidoreductase, partial [Sedimentisphaerales bacterium]|nr:Gfo/Idh/MocA family oxidoreductase [Sedimentisphaerales bacterium]